MESNGNVSFQLFACRWRATQLVEGMYFTWYATLRLRPRMQSSVKLGPRYFPIIFQFEFF